MQVQESQKLWRSSVTEFIANAVPQREKKRNNVICDSCEGEGVSY